MSLVFVYGTLKRGGSNHAYLAGQAFVGEAWTTAGFRLFELEGYPGMVALPADQAGVGGEVWSVDADCLAQLDVLEGVAEGLYHRVRASLRPPFADQEVTTYLYARSVAGCRELGSTWAV